MRAQGSSRGTLIPSPRAMIKLRMPHSGTYNVSKCPVVARGEGWALLELIDALTSLHRFVGNESSMFRHTLGLLEQNFSHPHCLET